MFWSAVVYFANHLPLPFHEIDLIDFDTAEITVDEKYNRQSHSGLGGCYGYNKDGENLAREVLRRDISGKSHKIYIDCIKHKLNRHENTNGVSTREQPENSQTEKDCG
jgi:hypothetical protein